MANMWFILELKSILLQPFSLLSLLLLIFLTTTWLFFTSKTSKNYPPSPPKLPILGNLHQLGPYPHRSLHSMAQRHGPFMCLQLGKVPTLVISSPELAKEIMKIHDQIFSNRPDSSIGRKLLYDYKDLALAPYGEYWRQMRSISVLQLLSTKRVRSYRFVREEETDLMIEKITKQSCSCSSPVNLSELFVDLTNDIVCRVAFNRKYSEGEGAKRFKKLLGEFGELLGAFNVGDFIPWLGWINYVTGLNSRVERVFRELDEFLERILDDHVASRKEDLISEDHLDFVDVLLQIQKDSIIGESMCKDSIKAIVLDVFAAGTDTTYTALEWTMTELLKHPEMMKEAQREIREITGMNHSLIEDNLEKMNFLKAVVKESFRLHPPVPLLVPRESTEDVKIQGHDVPAKTRVVINAWSIGRDPKVWKDPEKFIPDRFLNCHVDFKGHDFQLIPFGSGRRSCPGTTFAIAIIELALAKILHKFDWEVPTEAGELALDTTESSGITAHKKFPLVAVAKNCST